MDDESVHIARLDGYEFLRKAEQATVMVYVATGPRYAGGPPLRARTRKCHAARAAFRGARSVFSVRRPCIAPLDARSGPPALPRPCPVQCQSRDPGRPGYGLPLV